MCEGQRDRGYGSGQCMPMALQIGPIGPKKYINIFSKYNLVLARFREGR